MTLFIIIIFFLRDLCKKQDYCRFILFLHKRKIVQSEFIQKCVFASLSGLKSAQLGAADAWKRACMCNVQCCWCIWDAFTFNPHILFSDDSKLIFAIMKSSLWKFQKDQRYYRWGERREVLIIFFFVLD